MEGPFSKNVLWQMGDNLLGAVLHDMGDSWSNHSKFGGVSQIHFWVIISHFFNHEGIYTWRWNLDQIMEVFILEVNS